MVMDRTQIIQMKIVQTKITETRLIASVPHRKVDIGIKSCKLYRRD